MRRNCKPQKLTDWAESVKSRTLQYPGWFGKTPMALLLNVSISCESKVVFGILAAKTYKTQGKCNIAQASTRDLASILNVSNTAVSNWLKELSGAGWIERISRARCVGVYRLLSPVFAYRAIVETAPNARVLVPSEQLPLLRDKRCKCPKCRRVKRMSSSSGVCDECLKEWQRRVSA